MEGLQALFADRMQGEQSSAVRDLLHYGKMKHIISLAGGIPAADMFDLEGINEALAKATKEGVSAYQYSYTDGEPTLRKEVCELLRARNIEATIEETVISSGSQQGLDIVSRIFLNKGDTILVERPTYLAALQVFKMCEANIVSVAGNDQGLEVDALEKTLEKNKVKALYMVPNFANPTGSILSLASRRRIVDLAIKHNFIIFEDDPYGELKFTDQTEPSLYEIACQTEAGKNHVVYLTSFSKILVPGLRLGAIVATQEICERLVLAKQSIDLHTPVLSQNIVEEYLKGGRLNQRIPLISKTYKMRCECLMSALKKHVGDQLQFNKPAGGMFLWARLAKGMNATKLLKIAVKEGVVFIPGVPFYADNPDESTLRLSFATITENDAEEAAIRLARAIARYQE